MAYEPLHHKYRPQTFADLVGQTAIAATLSNAIAQRRIAPAYLFTGPRGTGKTSSARILAKSLNCIAGDNPTATPCGVCDTCRSITNGSALDVIEIDAASNTGVDNIREIIERAQFAPVQCRFKIYTIDECHMLSTAAFNALLKTLEEPPERVVFVLATTDPQRVLPTIISRCQRFDYRRIPLQAMVDHLRYIADRETINIDQPALTLVAQIANGGLRDAESLLDQLSLLPDLITPDKVWDLVGAVPEQDLLTLLTAIASDNAETLLSTCRQILNRGREPLVVLQNLASFYLNLLIAQTAPERSDLVAVTAETWQELCQIAPQWQTGVILQGQQKLKESEFQIRNTTQPRLWLEVTLLGLLPSACLTVVSNTSVGTNSPPAKSAPPNNLINFPGGKNSNQAQPSHLKVVDTTASAPPVPEEFVPSLPPPTVESHGAENNLASDEMGALSPAELEQIWLNTLNGVAPLTRSLLANFGSLVGISLGTATISVKTAELLKIAAGKKEELEGAISQACNQTIKVNLIVAKKRTSASTKSSPPPAPAIAVSPPPQVPASPPPPGPQSLPATVARSEIKPSPRRETRTTPKPELKSPPGTELLENISEEEARKAIEQFAKNFGGEIVASEVNQTEAPEAEELSSPSPDQNHAPPIINRPIIPLEDEDDLPF